MLFLWPRQETFLTAAGVIVESSAICHFHNQFLSFTENLLTQQGLGEECILIFLNDASVSCDSINIELGRKEMPTCERIRGQSLPFSH